MVKDRLPLLSAYQFWEGLSHRNPHQAISKRQRGEDCIRFISIHSPLAISDPSFAPSNTTTCLLSMLKACDKHPPSQAITSQGSSRTLLLFQAPRNHLKIRRRITITGVLQREEEDPTPRGYSAALALYMYVLPPLFMASLLRISAGFELLPFLGEIPGR